MSLVTIFPRKSEGGELLFFPNNFLCFSRTNFAGLYVQLLLQTRVICFIAAVSSVYSVVLDVFPHRNDKGNLAYDDAYDVAYDVAIGFSFPRQFSTIALNINIQF